MTENQTPAATPDTTPNNPTACSVLKRWYLERFGAKALVASPAQTQTSRALFWMGLILVGVAAIYTPPVLTYKEAVTRWGQADGRAETRVSGRLQVTPFQKNERLQEHPGGLFIQPDVGAPFYPVEWKNHTNRFVSLAGTSAYGHVQEGKLISIYTDSGRALYKAGVATRDFYSVFIWVNYIIGLGLVALGGFRQRPSQLEK